MASAITQDYLGRLTNRLSQVFLDNVGIGGAPLAGCTTGFPDADSPNSITTISLMLENVKGRTAQRLLVPGSGRFPSTPEGDPNYRVYSKYEDPTTVVDSGGRTVDSASLSPDAGINRAPANYGRPLWQQFKIRPDYIEESMYRFTLADLENLNDDAFIRNIVQKTLFETVRRRVIMRFYERLFDPYYFGDANASSTAGNKLTWKVNGVLMAYNQLTVNNLDKVHVELRKRLLDKVYEGGDLKMIVNPDGYAGISAANPNLNWANSYGSLEALRKRTYGKIKNTEIHEVDIVDRDEDIQHGGVGFTNRFGGAAPAAGITLPHLSSITDVDKFTVGSAATDFAAGIKFDTETLTAPDGSADKIVGAVFNKRAIGMGLWNRWEASRFAGNPLGTVTSFFTDPLSGVTFRLETYYVPHAQEYRIVCSAKVGFCQMDFRAAELLILDAA